MFVIEREHFQALLEALHQRGFETLGPTVRDGAIVYDRVERDTDFPIGWTDEQEPARYTLKHRSDQAMFGYVVGPHSWKKFLFPPRERLWSAAKNGNGFSVMPEPDHSRPLALIGVRACELSALAIQKKVFTGGPFTEPGYQTRSEKLFVVALNCGTAGGNCFCVSMQTGPQATAGFDLALTEIIDADRHYFVVEAGSQAGTDILNDVPHRQAEKVEHHAAVTVVEQTASQMGRKLETEGIKELLYRNFEHSAWEDIANRCLSCANCTMVCPTCFCSTVEDVTDITGDHAERWRRWDSCFSVEFSYIHGGPVRSTTSSRYRQWMTHKLASWIDQFGTSGCVGCGRCITWCPVGIDLTEEVHKIRSSERTGKKQ